MNQRVIAVILCLLFSTLAHAIQPVEAGIQPLYERLRHITDEQQFLNQRLQAAGTTPRHRALAYRRYQTLETERLQTAREIAQAKELAQSPLVTFMVPVTNSK